MVSADWSASQEAWTPDMMRKAASLLGEKERGERVMRGWEDARLLTLSAKKRPGCQVGVGVIRFCDEMAARAYVGLAVDLQRKSDELLNGACADGRRVTESRSSSVRLQGADEVARTDKRIQLGTSKGTLPVSQLWARDGNYVIEFTWNGISADMAWTQRVLDIILANDPL
jgi:hypothetical protein